MDVTLDFHYIITSKSLSRHKHNADYILYYRNYSFIITSYSLSKGHDVKLAGFFLFFFYQACSFRSTRWAVARLNELTILVLTSAPDFIFARCSVELNEISEVSPANKRWKRSNWIQNNAKMLIACKRFSCQSPTHVKCWRSWRSCSEQKIYPVLQQAERKVHLSQGIFRHIGYWGKDDGILMASESSLSLQVN